MKRSLYSLVSLLVLLSLLLGACTTPSPAPAQPAATEAPVVTEAPPEPTDPPAPTPTPEPTAVPEASAEQLQAAFAEMLASMEAYNTVKADALMEAIVDGRAPFLVDVRTVEELEENGHIEGAIHIPLSELAQHLDLLPAFDQPVVAYCGSGWRATIAMSALSALGWQDVKALKTTFQEWKDAGNPVAEGVPAEAEALNAAEADPALVASMDQMLTAIPKGYGVVTAEDLNTALAENPDLVVIDVRKPEEVTENGYVDTGSSEPVFIPLEQFVADMSLWPEAKDTPIAVYCGSGHRSTMAMAMLWSFGYENVQSLKGGFAGWAAEGYPTVGGAASETALLDAGFQNLLGTMQAYNTIKMDGLNEALAEDQPPFLLDVRTAEEVQENGHILGAVHVPLQELAQHLDLLPAFDVPVVAYCGSGWRATIAMTALSAMGWQDVKALKNTFQEWKDAGYAVGEGLPGEAPALNAAEVDPALVETFDAMLSAIPQGYGVVTAEAFNTALAENPDLIVIDVRKPEELAENGVIDTGGLPLIHIPLEQFVAQMDQWPAGKDTPIVVYCGSGHRSTMAMAMLWSYGFADVQSLKGGFAGWAAEGYPVAEAEIEVGAVEGDTAAVDAGFQALLDTMVAYNTTSPEDLNAALAEDQPPFLLDVRTTEEVQEKGHIVSAVHIPLQELAQHLDLLPAFDVPVVVYCGSGWRATIAMTALSAMGWQDVKALKTTFDEYVAAGYAVAEGLPEDGLVLDVVEVAPALLETFDAMFAAIPAGYGVATPEELNTALAENPDLIVVDVRRADEIAENGVIDTGDVPLITIPLEEFIAQMDQWPAGKDTPIVVYCGSGHRSTMAMTMLWTYGYEDVKSLKGGFGGWAEAGFPTAELEASQ